MRSLRAGRRNMLGRRSIWLWRWRLLFDQAFSINQGVLNWPALAHPTSWCVETYRALPALVFGDDDGEVAADDAIEVVGLHFHGEAVVVAVVADLAEEVAGLAAAHGAIGWTVVGVDEVVDDVGKVFALVTGGVDLEEFVELLDARVGDLDFVGDSAKEGFVDEVGRFEVGGEDDELFEGGPGSSCPWKG